ncbi:MAG TPA: hypothetical protein P5557_13695 [Candidatus Sumerlaeia bacterium]|nr:hypothetical protein [Candidatus Sumerlaeia bacterium]
MGSQAWTVFILGLAAFAIAFCLTPLMRGFAIRKKILSDPAKIKFYLTPRPLLGHVVLLTAFFVSLAVAFGLGVFKDEFYYSVAGLERISLGLFFTSLFLTISSIYADVRNDASDLEWVYIIVGALMLYFFGIRFIILKIPFIGILNLKYWGLPLLALWVLLVVSIVELLDFFEGLAGAVIAIVSLIFVGLHLAAGKNELYAIVYFALLFGAAVGILLWQFLGRRIIYGKSGNKVVGFIFAAGTVIAHRKEDTGQFLLFPIAILLFVIVVVNFLFLEQQLRPISAKCRMNNQRQNERA